MADEKKSSENRKIVQGGRTKFKKQISESSKQYLLRQAKDPYVKKALKEGYRSRAAFKLIDINDKYHIIKPGMNVVDLGAAPGGWCQVLTQLMKGKGTIVAIDKIPIEPLAGVDFLRGNFEKDEVYEELLSMCPDKIDVVVSDIAPETIGHDGADHLRCMGLVEMAADFALTTLKKDGAFVCKIFQGGEEVKFREEMRKRFNKVAFFKPGASRKGSREIFLVCIGFKG